MLTAVYTRQLARNLVSSIPGYTPRALFSAHRPHLAYTPARMASLSTVSTSNAPAAIGPYSQAIKTDNGMVFVSGCCPFDPKTMDVVGTDITTQSEQVFANLKAVLQESGCTLQNVAKATVFIKDMNDFAKLNEVYSKHMGDHKPARSCVEVARLPRDVLVEIEAIALTK